VGVTRQYCGQVGKQENCRVAVSLSGQHRGRPSLPIAWRSLLTRSVDTGQAAGEIHGGTAGNPISDQAGKLLCNKFAPPGTERSPQLRADRRRPMATTRHFREGLTELGLLLRGGYPILGQRVEARSRPPAQAEMQRHRNAPPSCYAAMASTIRLRYASLG